MDATGGEPDGSVSTRKRNFTYAIAPQTRGRRSPLDRCHWTRGRSTSARPAIEMAREMGIDLLTEEQYRRCEARRIRYQDIQLGQDTV